MLSFKDMSFKRKMVLHAMSVTCAALLLCVAAVTTVDWFQHHRCVIQDLTLKADILAASVTAPVAFNDQASAQTSLRTLGRDANVAYACVFDADETEFASFAREGEVHPSEHKLPLPSHEFSGGRVHLRRPILLDRERIGFVVLNYDLQAFYADLKLRVALMMGSAILALSGAYVLSTRVQRILVRPVTELMRAATAVSETQDFSIRATKRTNDELGVLTVSFNKMLAGIQQRDQSLAVARERLEQRVTERTADLAATNATLAEEIAERKQAGEALRKAKEYIDNVLRSMIDMLFVVAPDGTIHTINEATCNVLGYLAEELIGRPAGLLFSDEDEKKEKEKDTAPFIISQEALPFKRDILRRLVKDGAISNIEKSLCSKSGHTISVLLSGSVMRDTAGAIRGIVFVAKDITERKSAEAELRKLSLAVEQSPASVMITDTRGTIEYVNPRFCKSSGYTAAEVIGRNPRILKSGNKSKSAYKKLWDTILTGNVWTGAFENRKKNGELYWEEASISPMRDANGSVTHFIGVTLDITERKKAETSLRKTEFELRKHRDNLEELVNRRTTELAKINDSLVRQIEERREAERAAEAASSAKSEFLACMSHELRTPLNGVIGMIELLLHSDLSEKQKRHAWLAKASGDTLLTLINDILDFSKIEAGKLQLDPTDFDLRNMVESHGASLVSQAEGKGLELICSVHPQVPALVRGDHGRLQQILNNLTSNAVKFTEHGQVSVRATKDDETERSVTVRFTVTDTGIGIPPDRRDRLFQSFSQVDSSATRKYGGTGLGLAISKQLAELMDGEIGVESEPGRGSTFWFTVKLQRQAVRDSLLRAMCDDLRDVRILVVDDNATNREFLAEQLSSFGLDHETACNGEETLAKLHDATARKTPFGLAILDMQMPGMDGEQLAQAIKSDPSLEDTILLLLTSGGIGDNTDRLHALGFSGWLTKPVRQSLLLGAIVETLTCARTVPGNQYQALPVESLAQIRTKNAGARILLAEDNEISKEAAVELLALAGYECEPVANGKQVVQAVLEHQYDLILMDCQMPEMDGFDTTRAIRKLEKDGTLSRRGNGRIPIIALTANAIKGDRERCIESGMDDYVTKPLDLDRLVGVIENHLEPGGEASPVSAVAISDEPQPKTDSVEERANPVGVGASPPFDLDAMFKRWGANKEFVEKMIAMFCKQAPGDLETLEQALAAGDVEEATRFAHGLKGAASYVSADAFREVAARLEVMGRTGDLSDAEAGMSELRTELQRCLESDPSLRDAMEPQHAHPNC
jgi:PAS domain S-box-containing protein